MDHYLLLFSGDLWYSSDGPHEIGPPGDFHLPYNVCRIYVLHQIMLFFYQYTYIYTIIYHYIPLYGNPFLSWMTLTCHRR